MKSAPSQDRLFSCFALFCHATLESWFHSCLESGKIADISDNRSSTEKTMNFANLTLFALLLLALVSPDIVECCFTFFFFPIFSCLQCQAQFIKTPRLKPNDLVGWVTPAFRLGQIVSNFTKYREDIAKDMQQLGVRHFFSNHSFGSWGYFSATDAVRLLFGCLLILRE